MILNSAKSYVY